MKALRMFQALCLGAILLLCSSAFSATQTLSGTTVDFQFDDALTGLFGVPTIAGDTLLFTPSSFSAQALNNSGAALTFSNINIQIDAKAGFNLSTARLDESGVYILDSPGGGGTAPTVLVNGQVTSTAVNSNPTNNLASPITAVAGFGSTGLASQAWQAFANADLASLNSNSLIVTIGNILRASASNLNDTAFINKNRVTLNVGTTAIPIPASVWLFGSAILGLVAAGRRRDQTPATPA